MITLVRILRKKFTTEVNSDKIVMLRFLRNRRLLLRLRTIFRALTYWAQRAVIFAIAWLNVKIHSCRLQTGMFCFSSWSGQAPPYLADDIHLVSKSPRCRLRSSTDRSCAVPRTHNTIMATKALLLPGHVFGTASQYTCATL